MKKSFLSIFIVILMLFSQITVFASDIGSSSTSNPPEDKITDELKEIINNTPDGEYIPVYIWLNDDYSDELVYKHLSNKLGQEINSQNESAYITQQIINKVQIYKNNYLNNHLTSMLTSINDIFNSMSVEEKINSLRNKANISEIMTNEEIQTCLNDSKSYEEIIELSERYQYLSDYRDSRVDINEFINNHFKNKLNINKFKNLMIDTLLPYVEMECKKEYISDLASMNEVKEIGYLSMVETELVEEAEADEAETADKYILQPINTSYTGSGIKVGVLDGESFNSNASHLNGKNITVRNDNDGNNSGLSHSTKVMSIIAGEAIQLSNGVTYQGIAPNASLFFCYSSVRSNNLPCLYWLIVEKDVSIINISMELATYDEENTNGLYYDICEQYLDCLIGQYKVVIIKSAGNSTYITNPGKGYNLITVGNLSNAKDLNNKYIINVDCSSYEEVPYLTNKPDICAFGTNISMVYGGVETTFIPAGTSFAAPMVTGTVALMMEANPKLISHPNTVKTLLMSTADQDVVSSTNNNVIVSGIPTVLPNSKINSATGILREKSGAGLLNIEQAIEASIREDYHEYDFTTSRSSITTNKYYFNAGDKIEIAMVFDKINHRTLRSSYDFDFDIQIISISYNANNDMVQTVYFDSSSTETQTLDSIYKNTYYPSQVNNAELYEVTFNQSGYYYFKIVQKSVGTVDSNPTTPFSQVPSSNETHISHNSTTVSLAISCGCSNKDISASYANNLRTYSCSNCNTQYNEQISKYDISRTVTYNNTECGIVNFKLNYRAGYIDDVNAIVLNEYSAEAVASSSSNYHLALIVDSGSNQNTTSGYNETIRYELIIWGGGVNTSRFYTVSRSYDYLFDMTASMSVS